MNMPYPVQIMQVTKIVPDDSEKSVAMKQSLSGLTILVADDELSIRELLQDILEPEGVVVRSAASGSEALSVIETQQPDLAILDIRMPAPDGLTILRHLRDQGNMLPVVIITAHEINPIDQQILQQGANGYIPKPFDPEQILHVVEQTLQQQHIPRQH